jgi:sporulation protein YlmC with PRC-barrel domain
MSDPASWFVVEPGMPVHASDGGEVGTVTEVIGDEDKDIFNGLMVRARLLGGSRYVPSERVAQIYTDRIELDISADELDALDERGPQDL